MFEIFIALFGGLYLLGRSSTEKAKDKLYDLARTAERTKKDSLVNEKFQEELAKKIANPQYRKEIEELLKEDLHYVYGDAWKTLFAGTWCQPSLYAFPFSSKETVVLLLLLSKSGLIPQEYQFRRMTISNTKIANAYECLRILHCVEYNIRSKRTDLNEKLVFLPPIKYKTPRQKYDLGTPDYAHPCSGEFCWSFEFGATNAHYSVDIHSSVLINACKENSIGERSLASRPYKDKLLI